MTGDEHYREAERLLDAINGMAADPPKKLNGETFAVAIQQIVDQAQVHATLALAAATFDAGFVIHADAQSNRPYVADERTGWGYGR